MRLLLHDFGGYPFPIELARVLAARGHTVRHVYCGSLHTTPQGSLAPQPSDPPTLDIRRVTLRQTLDKFSFVRRWRQENEYGRLAAAEIAAFRPDVVLSGNTPLDAQRHVAHAARRVGAPFVFWLQDVISIATDRILRRKLPGLGAAIGAYYLGMERRLLRRSDATVAITADFGPLLQRWGVDPARVHVVENWAPLAELPVRPKRNPWSERHGLADRTCFFYTGTLGMKHNPALLLDLARSLANRPEVRVVVVSQGLGADWLRARLAENDPGNLLVLDYQPFSDLPDLLGAADVLAAVLEPDASVYSVPSKVLSYLCAARPLLVAMPQDNLAARIVAREEAGVVVVPPGDTDAFARAARALLDDPAGRARMGARARAYAERTFDIERIADAFERILDPARLRAGR